MLIPYSRKDGTIDLQAWQTDQEFKLLKWQDSPFKIDWGDLEIRLEGLLNTVKQIRKEKGRPT